MFDALAKAGKCKTDARPDTDNDQVVIRNGVAIAAMAESLAS